ncbi:hypothetical protein EIP91_004436 [Steccherinum ochraceum]|uniref:F-box domain-containing protein n=1 Tax=Steccherinum ochraceum TaxID=92696 RepID=A0A4R0R9T6_9APHY|nr:hypothetical protein EIP91_004436 [Steccherinum ochraceum]
MRMPCKYSGASCSSLFPPELVDQTIDHLHGDKATLKACSLVSRQWLNSTRHHLFRSTVIVGDSRHGFTGFLQFLATRPNIGLHIQELRLQGEVNLSSGRPQICKHEMDDLFTRMPKLQKLDLFGVRFGGCDGRCCGRPYCPKPRDFDQVTVVGGSDTDDFADTLDILRLFGDVLHFYVYEITWRTSDMPNLGVFGRRLQELGPPSQLQAHALAIGHSYTPCSSLFCEIMRFTKSVNTLTAIGAECAGWDHIEATGELMRDIGPSLLHFHLDVALTLMGDELPTDNQLRWRLLRLNTCPNLKSISVLLLLDDQPLIEESSEEERLYTCTNILDILSTVQDSTSMRNVTIKFAFEAEEEPPSQVLEDSMDWARLEEVLNGFANLETVKMVFTDGADVLEECTPLLLEKMHTFDERGLLAIKVLNDENLPISARV